MTDDQKRVPGTAIRKERKPTPGDPWADDVLRSKRIIADKLTNAVEDAARVDVGNAYVIGFHGEWGTGKTFVLERWCEELKLKENSPRVAVYYNAWEDDFQANPLVAIIVRLQDTMREMGKSHPDMKKFAPMLVPILKATNKIARACVGVSGVDFVAVILDMIKGIWEQGDAGAVRRCRDLRKEADDLKGNLIHVIQEVKRETNFPLVFVIDELDRCRPAFALEILERVKHLFNVPGVVFVLGFNKAGLRKSIGKVYGYDDVQSEKYLRRFFDREVSMPFSSPETYCEYLLYMNGVIDYCRENRSFVETHDLIMKFFIPMINFWELTLREVEILVRLLLDVINREKRVGDMPDNGVHLIVCLMFLKVKNPALYSQVIGGEFKCKDLVDEIMGIFCDEKSANPRFQSEFRICQNVMEGEIYRLASESDWNNMVQQIKSILITREEPPTHLALAKYTLDHGEGQVGMLYKSYAGSSDKSRKGRVSVKNIISFIE